jgi:hypothetical protein
MPVSRTYRTNSGTCSGDDYNLSFLTVGWIARFNCIVGVTMDGFCDRKRSCVLIGVNVDFGCHCDEVKSVRNF